MTTNNGGNTQPNAGADAQHQAGPGMNILAQYIKDFSFENPNSPKSLQQRENTPPLNIHVNVNANPMGKDEFEVMLILQAKAGEGEDMLFNVEVTYAGMFRIQNVPEEHVHPFVLIECPRMLFPFARQIVADATRNGGFPPLMVDPIDFAALYRHNLAQSNAQGGGEAGNA
ncbi:MAG: protein-export chaperone SecB [Hyphomicrobiales bacterium]|nr:MAG: protein-export chaperone SecB [Hyphomicrobiales bacterium]